MKNKKYNVVKSERTALGRFAIRLDTVKEGNNEYPYSFIEASDSVAILAEADGMFVLIRQYRHSVNEYLLEIPGGSMDINEDPKEAVKRELLEETGYEAHSIIPLGSFYPTVGSSYERCYLYYTKSKKKREQHLEPLEYLEVELTSSVDLEKMIKEGTFLHSMGLVAWLKYKMLIVDGGYADRTS